MITYILIAAAVNALIMALIHIMDYDFHVRAGDTSEDIKESQMRLLDFSWMPLFNIFVLLNTYNLHLWLNAIDDNIDRFNR